MIEENKKISAKGPIGKFFGVDACQRLMEITGAEVGDSIFMSCGNKKDVHKILSLARNKLAEDLKLIDENSFSFAG